MIEMHSYSKPLAIGHKALEDLFADQVIVQEKIDGSQINFGVFDGELLIKSRRATISNDPDEPGQFNHAVKTINDLQDLLIPDASYRGEYLGSPKHNTLRYGRVPKGHIILFDVDLGNQDYLDTNELALEAHRLGLESVPFLGAYSEAPSLDELKSYLDLKSCLGNVPIEGIVIKNYHRFDQRGKVLMGKLVADDFKEKHSGDWKKRNPTQSDFVSGLIETYRTEARWRKAIQHLTENGTLEGVPQDIPLLLKEVSQDIYEEYGEEIKEALFNHFWKTISRGVIKGLPEFYKQYLAENMFDGELQEEKEP